MSNTQPFLVYKSSAGSGKTFNLAKVYLSLILRTNDPNYFKRILAITFTVKAAAEMKDRIVTYLSILAGNTSRKRIDSTYMLEALIHETGLTKEEIKERSADRLDSILHQYGEFHIVTIDKFFARLIRAFAGDLTLAPDFEIQIDRELFIDRAADLLYERIGEDSNLTTLTLNMLRNRLAEDRSNNADSVIRSACETMLSDDFYFAKDGFKAWQPKEVFELKEQFDRDADAILEQLKQPAIEAMELIASRGLDQDDFLYKASGIYGHFRRIAEGDLSKFDPNKNAQKTIDEDKWVGSTKNPAVGEIKEQLLIKFQEIEASRPLYDQWNLINAIRDEIYALGFFSELERIFEEIREEDNVRLLSEFNTMISDQLQREQTFFLFERLGTQFNHVLIDEFQDTSVLQWRNLLPLIENSLSEGNTSLVVGDAKQSIYRWRNSRPEQFVRLPKVEHTAAPLLEASYEEIVLSNNFRSAKNIVAFNNAFFEQMSEQLLSEDHRITYQQLKQSPTSKDSGSVRWWVDSNKDLEKEDLMLQMVDRIRHMVDKEKVEPGDISCLFRTNSDAAEFASMLLQSGLKVVSQESLLLKNNPWVQLLIITLQGIQKDHDPFIVQKWLSRMHLARPIANYHSLAARARKEKWGFFQATRALHIALDEPEVLHGDTFQRATEVCQRLDIDASHPFVSKFLDICLQYENTGGYLKEAFLERWERMAENTSIQLSGTIDAISVMTIHRSKGLEFPIVMVFMPEIIKRKNTIERAWVELSDPFNLGNVPLTLSKLRGTPYAQLYDDEDARSYLDLLNVLYVAFTRAERSLEIFSKEPSDKSPMQTLFSWEAWDEDRRVLEMI